MKHKHYYSYKHAIFGDDGKPVFIYRYCSAHKKCKQIQRGVVTKWRTVKAKIHKENIKDW